MNIPFEGVSADGRIYVFAGTGFNAETQVHCCYALAKNVLRLNQNIKPDSHYSGIRVLRTESLSDGKRAA